MKVDQGSYQSGQFAEGPCPIRDFPIGNCYQIPYFRSSDGHLTDTSRTPVPQPPVEICSQFFSESTSSWEVRYAENMPFERISIDHRVMAGVPCIRGTRIPVGTVVGLVAEGVSKEAILTDYPQLTGEDVEQTLRYAAAAVDQGTLPLQEPA